MEVNGWNRTRNSGTGACGCGRRSDQRRLENERKLLSPSLWHRVYCGRVHDLSAPIHLKEAEAALFVAKHLVRSRNDGQGQRHLVLGDSTTLYVLGKGRASDSDPLRLAVARKWACISIAGDLLLVRRWIPSEFFVADTDSRRWENEQNRVTPMCGP